MATFQVEVAAYADTGAEWCQRRETESCVGTTAGGTMWLELGCAGRGVGPAGPHALLRGSREKAGYGDELGEKLGSGEGVEIGCLCLEKEWPYWSHSRVIISIGTSIPEGPLVDCPFLGLLWKGEAQGGCGFSGEARLRLAELSNGRWKAPSGGAPGSCLLSIVESGMDSHWMRHLRNESPASAHEREAGIPGRGERMCANTTCLAFSPPSTVCSFPVSLRCSDRWGPQGLCQLLSAPPKCTYMSAHARMGVQPSAVLPSV